MESRRRSLVKALSWRFIALTITTGLGYVFSDGDAAFAAKIGLADSFLKIFAYYAHERGWQNVQFGRPKDPGYQI